MTQNVCQNPSCREIFEGRANKVYCSSSCKSAVNNSRVAERDEKALGIERKLKANRRILRNLYSLYGEEELPPIILNSTKFDFQYNTGRTTQANSLKVLDYQIFKLENKNYRILKTV